MKKLFLLLLALTAFAATSPAHAAEFSLMGGVTECCGANLQPFGEVDLITGLAAVQFGAFYENGFLNGSTLRFFGGLARISFGALSGFFIDGKAGLTNEDSSSLAFGFGGGVGYRWSAGPFSVGPRFGLNSLTFSSGGASNSNTWYDYGIIFSLSL